MNILNNELIDLSNYVFKLTKKDEVNINDSIPENRNFYIQFISESCSEWQQEYELIYESHKLESF